MQTSSSSIPVITESEAAAAEVKYQKSMGDYRRRQDEAGISPSPTDYYVSQALFAAAYGGEAVQVVPDGKKPKKAS